MTTTKKRTRVSEATDAQATPLSAPALPTKIPQPHGGALLSGGIPGHRGAGGRPPDAVRAACLESFAARIPILEQIADGDCVQRIKVGNDESETHVSADPRDRISAIEKLGKFGGLSGEPRVIGAASGELTEGGFRFTLMIGEHDDDA